MNYFDRGGEIEITEIADFDLAKTFGCGQCFRWNADGRGVFTGVAYGRAARVRREGDSIFITGTLSDFETIWRDYFDLDRNYAAIHGQLCINDFMSRATEYGTGIRILKQDGWEALCSFIISQCNNIPRIKKIIAALCCEFGDEIILPGAPANPNSKLYAFPSAERIAALDAEQLAPLRCGYRAEYIIAAAQSVASGATNLNALSHCTAEDARAALKKIRGVGNKVADCVILYGLHNPDAFPVDVWISRAIESHLGRGFDPKVFHPYAGIAQQYIFHYIRNVI